MKNKVSKSKRAPAAAGLGMLPSDERQGGYAGEEKGHRALVLRGLSKKENQPAAKKTEPFSSPFGANEDKARSRGVHQQSMKDSGAFAPAAAAKTEKKKAGAKAEGAKNPSVAVADSIKPAPPVDEDAPITRQTQIMDIVYKYPEAVPVLTDAGLHCIGCQLSVYDDFQTGCAIHGFDDATIDALVVKMNEAVKEGRKKG
ncbi:MAG: DUF1858 domain-containing protein [Candidatus Micrarchaeota archaeon]|nr:DUF1858 domain-containing protein [Candidatus Micrarchaeota archaeon]